MCSVALDMLSVDNVAFCACFQIAGVLLQPVEGMTHVGTYFLRRFREERYE